MLFISDFKDNIHKQKNEVLDAIRELLPKGVHYYNEPFFIHYVEGEVANTEICVAIEVSEEDALMVRVHHKSEGYGEDDVDVTDGMEIYNYEPNSFADIFTNLRRDLRNKKLTEIKNWLIMHGENGGVWGKFPLDGKFRIQQIMDDKEHVCEGGMAESLFVNGNGEVMVVEVNGSDNYQYPLDIDNVPDDIFAAFVDYFETQKKRLFTIRVNASRTWEIAADNYEDALAKAQADLALHPLYDGDIDGWG